MILERKRMKKTAEHWVFSLSMLISVLIVLAFYSIDLNYNGEPNSRIGDTFFNFVFYAFQTNGMLFIEVIFQFFIFIFSVLICYFTFISKYIVVNAIVLCYLIIWLIIYFMFIEQGIFDNFIFFKSSIPFFLMVLIHFSFYYWKLKDKKHKI